MKRQRQQRSRSNSNCSRTNDNIVVVRQSKENDDNNSSCHDDDDNNNNNNSIINTVNRTQISSSSIIIPTTINNSSRSTTNTNSSSNNNNYYYSSTTTTAASAVTAVTTIAVAADDGSNNNIGNEMLPVFEYKDQIVQTILYNNNTNTNSNTKTNDSNSKNYNDYDNNNDNNNNNQNEYPSSRNQHQQQPNNNNNKVTLITAATGSGKSTQIPMYLLQHILQQSQQQSQQQQQLRGMIAVTQPRRVAAITLAQRVIYEYNNNNNMSPIQSSSNDTTTGVGLFTGQQLIGYKVRFLDTTNIYTTKLVYITDGMLLRDAIIDPLLLQYSIIFLDEAHERSISTDIVMGIIKQAHKIRNNNNNTNNSTESTIISSSIKKKKLRRNDHNNNIYNPLYVVVMSATLQLHTFIEYFGGTSNVNIIEIPGRQYPVQILYTLQSQEDYIESTVATILQIHCSNNNNTINNSNNGDVLVFLPGQEEIETVLVLLKQQLLLLQNNNSNNNEGLNNDTANIWTGDRVEVIQQPTNNNNNSTSNSSDVTIVAGVMICVLYAALSPEVQLNAFMEKPKHCIRKVILATNIAETSVTIPAIRYVIDTGKYKCRYMLSNNSSNNNSNTTGMECLAVSDISQAQALQRCGRAGRVQSGICFRLYTEDAYERMESTTIPEILRCNISQVILQLKSMGIVDPTTFDFVTPPNTQSIIRAMKVLYALSALDDTMNITDHGKKLAKLPLDPLYGHLLLQSVEYTCVKDMLTTVAVLSAENLFYRPSSTGISGGIDGMNNPNNNNITSKANAAHKRFISHEGDIPTYLNVYNTWRREAVYVPSNSGGRKAQKKLLNKQQQAGSTNKLQLHGDWCQQNYISGRALVRAYNVRNQLQRLCERPIIQNGLGLDVTTSYGQDRERFLKCIASGLFLQAASRIKTETEDVHNSKGRSGLLVSSRGRYRTKVGNEIVSVHPTSSMFNRQPAPKCVVYTELVVTKKSYIRCVTQIREEWLHEVAPTFYRE